MLGHSMHWHKVREKKESWGHFEIKSLILGFDFDLFQEQNMFWEGQFL